MTRHTERRPLPYRPDQMYELVAGVDLYPEFLPWCRAVRIRERQKSLLVADLVIGFKGVTERFTSRVRLDPATPRVDVSYEDGPFKHLENVWIFEESPDGCVIDFYVDFEFRSRLLQGLIGMVFTEAVRKMVRAFEKRAREMYGQPELPAVEEFKLR